MNKNNNSNKHTFEELQYWGESELINLILELENKIESGVKK